jgi:hypothetical protein
MSYTNKNLATLDGSRERAKNALKRVARFFLVQNTKMGNTKLLQNIPNVHKIYQKTVKWTKYPQNMPSSSIARPSKNCFPSIGL